ncbi:hypothetical protein P43SY_001348 [Pythium insidiosum]|uniref:Uncharacterized protein n=1 Tax=Pythium insidiosum TaxID=114742 RepID=A0AAD5LL84_PYTIN|nr:hypothetical protein P43SY_001348 [Pythium insidiosum]
MDAMPSTISHVAPPPSRWSRFLEEDAGALAFSTTLVSSVLLGRSFLQERSRVQASTLFHAQRAIRKTMPMVPAVFASSAVGIVGMKMTVAAVQDWRRDYTRASIKIALPLFVALLHAPRGPRAMAMNAIGYGLFIHAADYASTQWHLSNQESEASEWHLASSPSAAAVSQFGSLGLPVVAGAAAASVELPSAAAFSHHA